MYFFSHLYIGELLYKHLSKKIVLDKHSFLYGNIKPDLPSRDHKPHTLENYLFTVCQSSSQLMNDKSSVKEFSQQLGELCHYVSDFFCYYHLNNDLHDSSLRHCLYEQRLHIELHRLQYKTKCTLFPVNNEVNKNIASIIFEMKQSYYSKPKTLKRDIDYALLTTAWICKSIIFFRKESPVVITEFQRQIKH